MGWGRSAAFAAIVIAATALAIPVAAAGATEGPKALDRDDAGADPSAPVLLIRSAFDVMRRCWPDAPGRAEFGWHVREAERRAGSLLATLPIDRLREISRDAAAAETCSEETRDALDEVPAFAAKFASDRGAEAYSESGSWKPDAEALAALLVADGMGKRCREAAAQDVRGLADAIDAMGRMLDEYAGAKAAAALGTDAGRAAGAGEKADCKEVSAMIRSAIDLARKRIAP